MYIDEVTIRLENALQKLLNWSEVHGMCTNPAKVQIVFLGKRVPTTYALTSMGK